MPQLDVHHSEDGQQRSLRNKVAFWSSVSASCYYRKRGSASYIVREVRSVRERERYIMHTCRSLS